MRNRAAIVLTALGVARAGAGCKSPFGGPSREEVTAELRREAEVFKQKGEQSDPVLRLKSTWNIEGVDVVEQEGDGNRPYKGSIRFRIITTMRDPDGTETNDRLDKKFDYVYDVKEKRWLILYSATPARPAAPARPAGR
ncbi:MAG TPA: hypothetical protein VMT87_03995 [Vicinamibacteria bacterium]|nr:hypothetical protein [Vicinamibacteria bacterium]